MPETSKRKTPSHPASSSPKANGRNLSPREKQQQRSEKLAELHRAVGEADRLSREYQKLLNSHLPPQKKTSSQPPQSAKDSPRSSKGRSSPNRKRENSKNP